LTSCIPQYIGPHVLCIVSITSEILSPGLKTVEKDSTSAELLGYRRHLERSPCFKLSTTMSKDDPTSPTSPYHPISPVLSSRPISRQSSRSAFPALSPILSRISLSRSPTHVRDDGYDNFPPPLPSSGVELERRLTNDPDIGRQMAVNDIDVGPPPEGGKEAWLCVAAAFFVLFCVFGFGKWNPFSGVWKGNAESSHMLWNPSAVLSAEPAKRLF
jgi:hypothetical protein